MCNRRYISKYKDRIYFSEFQRAIYTSSLLMFAYWRHGNANLELIFSRTSWMGKCYLCACTFVRINHKGGRRNWCRGKTIPKLTLQRSKGQNDRKVSEITKRVIISVKHNSVESIRMLKEKITCGFSNTNPNNDDFILSEII